MATRVGLVKFWMTFFDWPTPKTPSFVQNSGTYLKCELSYCDFCMKICKFFVTVATGIGLIQISLAQLNRPAPKTLYLVQESWWYLLYKLSNGRFSDEIANFGVQQKLGWLSLIGLLQKTPVRFKNLGPILNANWVIVNFVWIFPNFCYHGNRGCLTQISLTPLNWPTAKTPYLVQKILVISLIQAE